MINFAFLGTCFLSSSAMDPAWNRRSEEELVIIKKTNCPGYPVQSGGLSGVNGILCAREIRYEAHLLIGPCSPALSAKVRGRGPVGGGCVRTSQQKANKGNP